MFANDMAEVPPIDDVGMDEVYDVRIPAIAIDKNYLKDRPIIIT